MNNPETDPLGPLLQKYKWSEVLEKVDHRFIDVDGTKVHYAQLGVGPMLILVHGWHNDWFGFLPLLYELQGFNIVALDLPGYGQSSPLPDGYSITKMADVIAQVIQGLGTECGIVCALSMGSAVVGDFALRHGDKAKCVCLMGAPVMTPQKLSHKFYRLLMSKVIGQHRISRNVAKRFSEMYFYAHFTARFLNMYHYDRDLVDAVGNICRKNIDKDALFDMGISVANYDLADTLSRIKIPTQLIYGSHDKVVDKEKAQAICQTKDNVNIAFVKDAGHVVSLEKPEQTAKLIKSFAHLYCA